MQDTATGLRRWTRLLALWVGMGLAWSMPALAQADDPPRSRMQRLADSILDDRRFQPDTSLEDILVNRANLPNVNLPQTTLDTGSVDAGQIAQTILYIVLGVIGVLLLFWLISAAADGRLADLFRSGGRKKAQEDGPTVRLRKLGPAEEADDTPPELREADRLAQRGQWAEAMHHVLSVTLDQVRQRAGRPIPRYWTAREILRRLSLPQPASDPLSLIVRLVERTHFGGYPADQGQYESCRSGYLSLSRALTLKGGRRS